MFDSINEDMPPTIPEHVDVYRDLLTANGHTVAPIDSYESDSLAERRRATYSNADPYGMGWRYPVTRRRSSTGARFGDTMADSADAH